MKSTLKRDEETKVQYMKNRRDMPKRIKWTKSRRGTKSEKWMKSEKK